ncbi:MAG TPA: aspartate--tRNA(Asn) ligase [Ktedonobacteraceae bacterium]|nr:aspartate--tRNA(Asn) ligase [Ktedonobacteraceae bacterium]
MAMVMVTPKIIIARKALENFFKQVRQGALPAIQMADLPEEKHLQEQIRLQRITTNEVRDHIGERIRVAGWLHSWREMGGVSFLVLRDAWGTVQAVAETEEELHPLREQGAGVESALALSGRVVAMAQAPGGVELHDLQIEVISPAREAPVVPLNKPRLTAQLGTLLDHAVVTNRHPTRRAILRLGAGAMQAFRAILDERGFTEIQTPKIVAGATESGATVFEVNYFGRPAYLAQSPQFYKQIMVGVFERVYEVGPVFRADPHDTTRHINEYVSLDVECGFIENHFTVMALLRDILANIMEAFNTRYINDLHTLRVQMPHVPEQIPHLHFSEAQELIYRLHGVDERGEQDLSPQGERWLGAWALKEFGSDFLYITGYPTGARAFYTCPDPERPEYSYSFDLLFRGVELVSGSQRLHRYEDYVATLEQRHLPLEPFQSYLEVFRYGMPPHGGFAIGLERLLMQLTGVPNIRLATTFPRDTTRLTP